ncbi:Por secretion system C-terminal sorting domain-containing protein [Pricia antarctica]|uniref:Por secretion system C-terminal sorting domain-containing protein n=2 Tax=Pricia antarctica TaxID=641691 RepID=A0A1G6VQS2_9FLAO|nr:Por secretion system C-terminal sorting domain-containing protein [Pricia antarctica]
MHPVKCADGNGRGMTLIVIGDALDCYHVVKVIKGLYLGLVNSSRMHAKLRLLFSITMVFLSFYASAQAQYWERQSARNAVTKKIADRFDVQKGEVFSFQENRFKASLGSVTGKGSKIVYFPNRAGDFSAYSVVESPVFSPELSQKYPQIKSYIGHSMDDSKDRVRFSISPKEVQAMIVHADGRATSFVQKVSGETYVMYSRDSENITNTEFICSTKDRIAKTSRSQTAKPVDGQVLRKYRLAITTSAEYTAFHGGTVADALAAINATITRVNEVFETDLAVTLELVGTTDAAIFTDPDTDPFSGTLAALGNQGQKALTDEVGEANYDIGHVLHKGGNGGNAGFIGAICVDNQKGSAYSSSQNPKGDIFDLDFVAHELGHQLGANHSWSYESEGTTVQVEPGSGTTIMGYAGIIVNENVTPNGDDYFHYVSIEQIIENLTGKTCGEVVPIADNPPVVNALATNVIPKSTAFVLSGNATDPDPDDILTYTWEQIDNGIVKKATFGPTNPNGANFRSRPPIAEPIRYFPMLSRVVAGSLTQTDPALNSAWETVSEVERDMNFAFTVRDNAPGGGQVVSQLTTVSVTNRAGPFLVISQAANEIYAAGEVQEIIWDVADTDIAPVNAQTVDILLSTDGGLTFPVALAEGVANDGTHEILVPGLPTSQARVMVKAADNVFLAVNASDFSIVASEIVLNISDLNYEICQSEDLTIPFVYESYLDFDEEVRFSIANAPAGLEVSFSADTVTMGDTPVSIFFDNTGNVPKGNYDLLLTATSASITRQIGLRLTVFEADFPDAILESPTDGSVNTSARVALEWQENPSYTSYEIQIATDENFEDVVETAVLFSNRYMGRDLGNDVTYFWRIKPFNECGEGSFSSPFSFTTIPVSCDTKAAFGLPEVISSVGEPSVVSTISFFEDRQISDLNVNLNIDHNYLEDVIITLTSPSQTTVTLVANACGDFKNINATFDDDANDFICGAASAVGISGTVKPSGNLDSFKGESILGEWILEIQDIANGDGGSLNAFSLDVCIEGDFRPDADQDGVFDDGDDQCLGTPEGAEVDASGCPVYRFPSDNFSISVESLSCPSSDDGKITVEAVLLTEVDYRITITGNGTAITDTFTDTFTAPNLSVGSYTVCINGSEAEIEYEAFCIEATVVEPEPLVVTSQIAQSGNQVMLSMEGADAYTVILNGKTLRTEKFEITLDLSTGSNTVKVFTGQICQGVYEDQFFISTGPTAFPNPVSGITQLFLGGIEERLSIAIFSVDGQLVKEDEYVPNGNQVNLDFTGLSRGVYIVKFEGENTRGTTKVIKR